MFRRPPKSPLFPSTPLSQSPLSDLHPPGAARRYADLDDRRRERAVLYDQPVLLPRAAHRVLRAGRLRSEEHTSELQSQSNLVCRLLLEKKKIPLIETIQSCS